MPISHTHAIIHFDFLCLFTFRFAALSGKQVLCFACLTFVNTNPRTLPVDALADGNVGIVAVLHVLENET